MRLVRSVLVAAGLALGCGSTSKSSPTATAGGGGAAQGGAGLGGNAGNSSVQGGAGATAAAGMAPAGGGDGAGMSAGGVSGGSGMSGGAGNAGSGESGSGGGDDGPLGASCVGASPVCGPQHLADCCASSVVPGGTFNRSNRSDWPATISDFRLDLYEVTVARFRRFVADYPANLPSAASGKNPNNAADPGWDATWDASFVTDLAALQVQLKRCSESTWTDQPGAAEALPMNCITWYEAMAFCIWDGGRLPTEAEWNYAAAGGSEQREFPWSSPPDSTSIDASFAVYDSAPIAEVGSKSQKGDGKWGHADLAGNVFEWVQDNFGSYPTPCIDCAFLDPTTSRGDRGGSWASEKSQLSTDYRGNVAPSGRQDNVGVRCARPL